MEVGGASDFIEKGSAPAILIARLRTQLRHKLALNHLDRLTRERDTFATRVLEEITATKSVIVHLTATAIKTLTETTDLSTATTGAALEPTFTGLTREGAALSAFASEVISRVRDKH